MKKINIIADIFFFAVVALSIVVAGMYFGKKPESTVETYDFTILEKEKEISALFSDDKYVYVGTNEGMHVYDSETLELVKKIDDIKMVYTASIVRDSAGGIWVGHEKGLSYFDSDFNQQLFSYPDIPKGRVNTIAEKNGEIICGTYNGAAILSKESGAWQVKRILTSEDGLISDSVNVVLPLDDGIIIGSYLDEKGGITYIPESTLESLDKKDISCLGVSDGLPHPYVTSVIERENGDVLVGTGYMREGGLAVLGKDEISNSYFISNSYTRDDGLPGEKIRFLFEDEKYLWITTEYDGVLIKKKSSENSFAEGESIYLDSEKGLSDNEIKCITKVGDDYWLGGKYGLTIVPSDILGE